MNRLGGEMIASFNYRARFLPDTLRDSALGFRGEPERLDRRSQAPPPEVPGVLGPRTARGAVGTTRRVIDEF